MLAHRQSYALRHDLPDTVFRDLWQMLTIAGRATVLFFSFTTCPVGASFDIDATNEITSALANGVRLFEFTCTFHLPASHGRLDGMMASDGSQHRIVVYWIEPAVFRESPSFVRYSDFLFGPELVQYCVYPGLRRETLPISGKPPDSVLLSRGSAEHVAQSALAIVNGVTTQINEADAPLRVGEFFLESRGLARHVYKIGPDEADGSDLSAATDSDTQVLNAPPCGREYSKETQGDGTLSWCARRTLDDQLVVGVTIMPATGMEERDCPGVFDPATLGQWTFVPDAYRLYWSLDREYLDLSSRPDEHLASRGLCDRIESYLSGGSIPPRACWAVHRLWFRAALMADDLDHISRSMRASVAVLCRDNSLSSSQCLAEAARISGQIEIHRPQQAEELLRPLVRQVAARAGRDAVGSIERLMTTVEANKSFTYGRLLIEEFRRQGMGEEETLDTVIARFQLMRSSRSREPVDPCETPATVQEYMANLDANPPQGTIDMNDLRQILEKGLAKHYAEAGSQAMRTLVEDVLRSIRLIVGDGPFRGDQTQLIRSVERFTGLYRLIRKATEPIDTTLATLLALSFCDISTPHDHEVLFSQFRNCCTQLQSDVNTMLRERALSSLVTPEDVQGVFAQYERTFSRYTNEPLWPTFKFPFTANEETRLVSRLRLSLTQLAPPFNQVSLKVRYGGGSEVLRQKALYEISRVAQQLLPEAAHLRKPPYPGVSMQYRGRYGFTAMVQGSFYREGERPKEKFRVMKYFHLGHRLDDIVKRERELTRPLAAQE